jgi:hypothetical protein
MLKFRLKLPQVPFSKRPVPGEAKEKYISHWKDRIHEGQILVDVTAMPGYTAAIEHFERVINAQIKDGTLNLEVTRGIQQVFDFFETGAQIVQANQRDLEQYKDIPE